jgi:8-oxo-dGTP pyrophosphatase MutT (NUDIX family)
VKSNRIAICLIEDSSGNLLYGKRRDSGKYCLPAGHVKSKEDPFLGALRELKEETGLVGEHIELVKACFIKKNKCLLYLFKVGKYSGKISVKNDPDKEFESVEFLNPMDIIEEMKVPLEDDIALKYYVEN